MSKYDVAFIIGRFQPVHIGHIKMINAAKEIAKKVVILLGSANASPSVRNPFSAEDRIKFLNLEFPNVQVIQLMDYPYSDRMWVSQVEEIMGRFSGNNCIFGCNKDDSTYYLGIFPSTIKVLDYEPSKASAIDATLVRQFLYADKGVKAYLGDASHDVIVNNASIGKLKAEAEYVRRYKEAWKHSPFPPMFVTVDALVIHKASFLAVRRKGHPGKGLLALPGGFLNQGELIADAALRELREETTIKVFNGKTGAQIKFAPEWMVKNGVFDHPGRSSRGRVITHGFSWVIPDNCTVEITAADDAADAIWVPLSSLNDPMNSIHWMEDHWHIANALKK